MGGVISRDAIEGIGTLIDDAAIDLDRWQAVVDELARTVPGTRVVFQVVDPALARAASMVASGWDASDLSDYARHYGAINPWVPAMLRAPAGRVLFSEQELQPTVFRRSEFYQDWLRHIGEADASTGMKLMDHGDRIGAITFSHDVRHADRVNADGAQVLKALAPRIRRSLDIGRTVAVRAWHEQTRPLVGALAEAAFIVTCDGRLLETNTPADVLIAASGMMRIEAGDRVSFADPKTATRFATGVRRATSSAMTSEIQASTPIGDFMLTILGLRPDMLKSRGLTTLLSAAGLALVVIRSGGGSVSDKTEQLLRQHGLTQAEIRLALAMDGSRSLRSLAGDLGIGYETARSQIKAIFAKLGISRQSELVAFLIRVSTGQ